MKDYITFKKHRQRILADPQVRKHYDELAPEYELIRSVIDKRLKKNISQEELARRIGTQQSSISRFESGNSNPSLKFLQKVARALGARLTVSLQ